MKIIRSTHVADAVLSIVCELAEESSSLNDDLHWYVEPYQNGREHGWSILVNMTNRQVSFSEDRRSDNIVVYSGVRHDSFNINNIPSEPVYEKAVYFMYNQHYDAAKYIVDFLSKEGKEE